ncbi:MAG: hypothetical protein A2289_24670 [Deltaproteobacteria bacterium RIFOXYA12_FULL_58_15]|nr:MAG: hypothetical protein A2289_24670 [Deltaproteobacteria bacterium RIFOXYA12_FULL_58_15]
MCRVHQQTESSKLSRLLDTLVHSQPGPPGFVGKICVGVEHEGGVTWWTGSFRETVETKFSDDLPEDFDVAVLLSGNVDKAIFEPKSSRSGSARRRGFATGDKTILARFLNRYVRTNSVLDLRCRATLSESLT